jgi:oxygen-independent coproporphyrinogen-3 oxidase
MTSLYIHIPFCESKCSYCGFYSVPVGDADQEGFVNALLDESRHYDLSDLSTVYIGGGSPSALRRDLLYRIVDIVIDHFEGGGEFTAEVNPGQCDEEMLFELCSRGVNRLSIGAQCFNEKKLNFLGRGHGVNDIYSTFEAGRKAGFGSISVDLMFAVPGVSVKQFRGDLKKAVGLGVEHISAYALSYEAGSAMTAARDSGDIEVVSEEDDRAMYLATIDYLFEKGFLHYEISNFAKAGFECEHNLRYWANEPFIGLGPSAHSYYCGRRTENVSDVVHYVEAINGGRLAIVEAYEPGEVERACETAVLGLRLMAGLDLKNFEERTGYGVSELFGESVRRNVETGLLDEFDGFLRLTREGLVVADRVLSDFSQPD